MNRVLTPFADSDCKDCDGIILDGRVAPCPCRYEEVIEGNRREQETGVVSRRRRK